MEIRDAGRDNRIDVPSHVPGLLEISGDGNVVRIGQPVSAGYVTISLGAGNSVEIAPECALGQLQIYAARDAQIRVGRGTYFNGRTHLYAHEPRSITIGAGCLFAPEIDVTVSDMHSVIDLATGKRINPPDDVRVGDRVWIGQGSRVLKGASIGDGSIVGAGSMANSELPANCLAAGSPARVLRTNVSWDLSLLPVEE